MIDDSFHWVSPNTPMSYPLSKYCNEGDTLGPTPLVISHEFKHGRWHQLSLGIECEECK